MSEVIKAALIGNPNTGKTSLFNVLTGLNQKVGNYPGVTVDKKTGSYKIKKDVLVNLIDLPGTYSINTTSIDENVAMSSLTNSEHENFPDVIILVADIQNLKRNLLLFTQIKDFGIPTILAINMADEIDKRGIDIDINALEVRLNTKIALISAKKKIGIENLNNILINFKSLSTKPCFIPKETVLSNLISKNKLLHQETVQRYQFIKEALHDTYKLSTEKSLRNRIKLDKILLHSIFGYLIFFLILLTIFQALYSWSSIPMDFIDESFSNLSIWLDNILPSGILTKLLTDGIIPGVGGIVIFIPQISFLFLFLAVLEECGYMSRVVFLMDKIMRRFGLSGKSVVPLISGTACAIPAIMATRNIENWKERLLTILVTPFTTCSARLPVYVIIISLIIPEGLSYFGFSAQALVLMLLYLLGFVTAIFSAYVLDKVLKLKSNSYFIIEMPEYKVPIFKNIWLTILEKTKSFVFEAGKVILAISILLWVLASFGPTENFTNADKIIQKKYSNLNEDNLESKIASYKLEHSYIGIIGKSIEPVIKPLGYDWKIGIALITSFAAREVFVGTLATIYSVGSEEELPIKQKMNKEVFTNTNVKVYSFATGISLLLFYALSLQCMSTVAIVKRETNGWKWPITQFISMTLIAYLAAFIAYQLLK